VSKADLLAAVREADRAVARREWDLAVARGERIAAVRAARLGGATFPELAVEMNVTPERARQIASAPVAEVAPPGGGPVGPPAPPPPPPVPPLG
jgi:hypothetical protein